MCVQLNEGTSKRTGAILKLEIRHCHRSRLFFSSSPLSLLLSSLSCFRLLPLFIEHGETHLDDGNILSEYKGEYGYKGKREEARETRKRETEKETTTQSSE